MEVLQKAPFLLVAAPHILDVEFKEKVILLLECKEKGSRGLILNQKSPLSLDRWLQDSGLSIPQGLPAWFAGPFRQDSALLLHKERALASHKEEIAPGIFLSNSQDTLEEILKGVHGRRGQGHPYRLLLGGLQWEPGQLERELRAGYWLSIPLEQGLLFQVPHILLWGRALSRAGFRSDRVFGKKGSPLWMH